MKCDYEGNLDSRKKYVIPLCTTHNRSRSDKPIIPKDSTVFLPLTE